MPMPSPHLVLSLLFVLCFGLAAWLQPRQAAWAGSRAEANSLLELLLGDSRRLFASYFFTKADVYLHSGYYPSIFDAQDVHERLHITEQEAHPGDHQHETGGHAGEDYGFLGPPRDWLDRFSRHFYPTRHTHLESGPNKGEVLPWLRVSTWLDPHGVESYTVAAYWLRQHLGRPQAAVELLHEAWRANPDSPEILFELGRAFADLLDDTRARNLWELGLRKWHAQEDAKPQPNLFLYQELAACLAALEQRQGRTAQALRYLELLKSVSPYPEAIQKQIDKLREGQR
jgi:tetratricopeptide (TPR) repeat protein